MSPTKPPTAREKYGGGRRDYDRAYNAARDPVIARWRSSRRWQRCREVQLRTEPLCRPCAAEGRVTVATDVDHIEPVRSSPDLFWSPGNWQSLCRSCHNAKTRAGR